VFLTRRTEYALRLLMLLAVQPGDAPLAVPEAARRLGLSAHHLAKVAQDLAGLGVVETTRGRKGGLCLTEAARARTLGEIVRALEPVVLAECFDGETNTCVLTPACRLAGALQQAGEAFFVALDRYTLADLVVRPIRLRRLLAP
jgi:Rrf2 family transcriptional regulator, nitric oxide-sensitive transcriptional repressor